MTAFYDINVINNLFFEFTDVKTCLILRCVSKTFYRNSFNNIINIIKIADILTELYYYNQRVCSTVYNLETIDLDDSQYPLYVYKTYILMSNFDINKLIGDGCVCINDNCTIEFDELLNNRNFVDGIKKSKIWRSNTFKLRNNVKQPYQTKLNKSFCKTTVKMSIYVYSDVPIYVILCDGNVYCYRFNAIADLSTVFENLYHMATYNKC
jgi:hypothetical protein